MRVVWVDRRTQACCSHNRWGTRGRMERNLPVSKLCNGIRWSCSTTFLQSAV